MNKENVYIIIPAYNEGESITSVLLQILKEYKNVVVVNDSSSDDTSSQAEKTGATVLNHIVNRGQGAALETGTKYAIKKGAEVIVHFDADGQFLVGDISRMIEPILSKEVDIVMGSRFMGEESDMPVFKKNVIMPIARLILRVFYGAKLTDPQNGFRAFSREYAKGLNIQNDGAAHCTEIIVNTIKNGWSYREIPVTVKYDSFGQGIFSGKGRGSGGVKVLKSLFFQKLIK